MATDYYAANWATRGGLYTDHLIYSPDVRCFRADDNALLDAVVPLSFITAPAPNRGALGENLSDLEPTFRRRIGHVLAVAAEQRHETLVLGAWGCGVFRNDPAAVAGYFADALAGPFAGVFREVVFAVRCRNSNDPIFQAFAVAFG